MIILFMMIMMIMVIMIVTIAIVLPIILTSNLNLNYDRKATKGKIGEEFVANKLEQMNRYKKDYK